MMVEWVRRGVAAGLLAGCGALQACATPPAPPPPQVCGDAGVVRQVDESLRARGRELALEAPVGEVSTETGARFPPMAHCAVRGHTVGYDTNRYGASPVYEPFIIRYSVELRHNGLFVRVE